MSEGMSKYKVVPVEMTDDMRRGFRQADSMVSAGIGESPDTHWRAMCNQAPETGMVAVPRELLERIVNTNMADYSVIVYQHKEIRTILEKTND